MRLSKGTGSAAQYSSTLAMCVPWGSGVSLSTKAGSWLLKTPPGEIALTRTPWSAQYVARYLVKPIKPCLMTEVGHGFDRLLLVSRDVGLPVEPLVGCDAPRSDAMFRITPRPRFAIAPPNTCEHNIAPVRPTAISVCHAEPERPRSATNASRPASRSPCGSIAALLTRISTTIPRLARSFAGRADRVPAMSRRLRRRRGRPRARFPSLQLMAASACC